MPDRTFTEHSARLVRAAVAYLLAANGLTWAQERIPELIPPSVPGHGRSHLDPADVGAALDMKPGAVVAVDFLTSAHAGFDVFEVAATSFPTNGRSFLVMSTGNTSSALLPNDSGSTSTELDGLNTSQGQDMVQIVLVLQPPARAACLAFDFGYYSEEFPEWVGSQFNDAFIAEIGQSNFEIVDNQVISPYNFAFDEEGNVISINTLFGVTAENAAGTTYDAGTLKLTAWTPLEGFGGAVGRCSDDPDQVCSSDASCAGYCVRQVTVTLSIMDLGDPIFDSTAFIDNFRWISGVACEAGADVDTDGDALLDRWESDGIDLDGDGIIDLDLPAMGADPLHKDIFVEIDYMVLEGATKHSHRPKEGALKRVIEAFNNAPVPNPDGTEGIIIHIDAGSDIDTGSDSIMIPVFYADGSLNTADSVKWGTMSKSDRLGHQTILGTGGVGDTYDWTAFDAIKNGDLGAGTPSRFSIQRAAVFHYCVFAHLAAYAPGPCTGGSCPTSGIARGIPSSDFIVSLGALGGAVGDELDQGGTLMHELGHNLGLLHGGDDHAIFKPNYLSVMNYFFQRTGLIKREYPGGPFTQGHLDYSRWVLPELNEENLDEPSGLNGFAEASEYGTVHFFNCVLTGEGGYGDAKPVFPLSASINWNTDGAIESGVKMDLNCSGARSVLRSTNNWEELVFNGGAVGHLGEAIEFPQQTESNELTNELYEKLPANLRVSVLGPGLVRGPAGASNVYLYTIANTGENHDLYVLTSSTTQDWADTSGLPETLSLSAGASAEFLVPIFIPPGVPGGTTDKMVLSVISTANPLISDSAETRTVVLAVTPSVSKGPMIALVLLVLAGIAIKFGRRRSVSV